MKHCQLSIYDFLQDGESQEVQPSETVPQVDEAPESALDANESTEDTDNVGSESSTDSTLFSVGDTVKVKNADEMYSADGDPESYFYLKELEGDTLTVRHVGDRYIVADDSTLYKKEVIKIN